MLCDGVVERLKLGRTNEVVVGQEGRVDNGSICSFEHERVWASIFEKRISRRGCEGFRDPTDPTPWYGPAI
jgi:hypothetical protein